MDRLLNVGIVQMAVSDDTAENLEYLEARIADMMGGFRKPELVVGVECLGNLTPEEIPGPMTEYFASIAKKYGIYLIPGTISERSPELPKNKCYNSAPIFDPQGRLIDVYRKMVPWCPTEQRVVPGDRYVVFDIPEKKTKVGVQICYDFNFPEISRNETLMGAEVLVKITLDPQELAVLNRPLHFARPLENQAYLVSVNGVGLFHDSVLYGHSMVVDPQGYCVWEAEDSPAVGIITLDLSLVEKCRKYGTFFIEHYLQHLRAFPVPMPFAEDIRKAPLFKTMDEMPQTMSEYNEKMEIDKLFPIGKKGDEPDINLKQVRKNLDDFLKSR